MNRQRPDVLGQGILFTVTRRVQRFRLGHALLLVALAVALVLDALLHAAVNRAYSEGEVQAWQQVLGLADAFQHQARVDHAIKSTPPKPAKKCFFGPPPLRVVRPDEGPPERSK